MLERAIASLYLVTYSLFVNLVDQMTSFRTTLKRSRSSYGRLQRTFSSASRQRSTFSATSRWQRSFSTIRHQQTDRPSYFHQASIRSNPDAVALTDKLSRFSLEEPLFAADPSPLCGRVGFPIPSADVVYNDNDDDDEGEISEEEKV